MGAYKDDDKGANSGSAYIYHSIDDLSLPVQLSSFTATSEGGAVTLFWRTESEVDNLGFDIYRSDSKDGPFVKVNTLRIPGAGTSGAPHEYEYVDKFVGEGQRYFYYIEDIDFSGIRTKSHVIEVLVAKKEVLPKQFALLQNFPNPFNPDTWIPYELPRDADVQIRIYDVSGRLVRKLDLKHKEAGYYITKEDAAYWDGRNDNGDLVASGVYFYRIQAGDFRAPKKMVVTK